MNCWSTTFPPHFLNQKILFNWHYRPEALILLIFFVMYMGFMMFCAQSNKSSPESQSSSLTNSLTSNDSAIHSDCNVSSDKGHHYSHHPTNREVYGQFHFDPKMNNIINDYNSAITERTPLVKATSKSIQIPIQYPRLNSQQNFNVAHSSEGVDHMDSVSINVGLAVKNTACIVKNPDEHEENWVSSNWILVPMFPLTLSMKILTPCKFKNTCCTIWTFIVSIGLIGALTYVSVWMVHLFGQSVGISETVAGMTILSWGTGIPELIASIVLIKKTAQADMAICNTIGSNVIDISFCLSLPWVVKCIINKSEGLDPEVAIQSAALPWTSLTLLISVALLLLILKLHNWELSFSVGVWLLLTYSGFVLVATYLESSFSKSGLDLLEYM